MSINDKIKQVLTIKNLSPSYLADDIGVQRSSISHILSGRNRPSLDIIQKIVRRFPEFTYEWFLESDTQLSTNQDQTPARENLRAVGSPANKTRPATRFEQPDSGDQSSGDSAKLTGNQSETIVPKLSSPPKPLIDRILIFYTDGTFREYTPA
ncbi:helix-turn-helix transcriptional regulator [Fibrella forsythiae]|uniref:Helix-turn-helix transcriptional regulator n=1 Tax=Fibrella forsythiae TaxID=2817061 RepID=A0ABS3JBK7_9BACT|nr:helix-turn-helix transcriptional regulator [Fibrella forsythiae]MBO0947375.1 helix-turn-helix transcriptional regulator [Fibrella forsythiae]